ncbi:MAG TPA: ATPase, T2SS/T4P/T4SS family [Ilumatobacteraceae bacterium]|nr:ATPase, T2SS/T4P/T4SS family [Ilumatobacteraceae bacterium]
MSVDRNIVRDLTARLSSRLVEAIESDTDSRSNAGLGASDGQRRIGLREDRARLELLMGRWMAEEIARLNQLRLQRGDGLLDECTERSLRAAAYAETVGAGPLEPYMSDPDVEEIDVNSHAVTWVSYSDGRKEHVGQLWDSVDDLHAFQRRLTLSMGVAESRLDEQSPMVTLQAPDGSRVVMVLGGRGRSGVSSEPRIAIRRFTVKQVGLDGLAKRGLFPLWLVPQLEALVRAGMTILVSGGPGAGKTTLLKELLGAVSPLERIVTVEKGLLELRLETDPRHPDAPALFTRQANTEGRGAVSARELVELSRRMNPDRVVVGELVEDEALEMLDVASMCKQGSMATIHAHTVEAVISRLAFYVAKSNTKLPEYAVWSLIAETIDFVIHIDMVRNGDFTAPQRCVTSILEIGGRSENGGVRSTETWGMNEFGQLVQRNPLSEHHLRRLRLAGASDGLFVPNDRMLA